MSNPGDVVWLDFPGAMLTKRRPAVIISSAIYHAARPDVILGLVTSQTGKAIGPTDCQLNDWSAAGLKVPSAFRAFLVTVPRSAIISHAGRLSDRDWQAVCRCVQDALADP